MATVWEELRRDFPALNPHVSLHAAPAPTTNGNNNPVNVRYASADRFVTTT